MKFSESWLREWVDPPLDTDQLAALLTMAGLEVDAVEPAAPPFSGVVVAEVLSAEPHPDAEKLRVCRVNTGKGDPLQIVCGAPNARPGLRVPLATVGALLPGDLKIKNARLRGVESSGMLCSARELGLSEESGGLLALPGDAPVGEDIRSYLSLDDRIIEVDFTPNRGDCLGIEGMAREIGALTGVDVRPLETVAIEAAILDEFELIVAARDACPRYLGRVIRGVNPSAATPLWMRERLRRGGMRSIAPLVDVTNYVMLELGQPMHAFDLARLRERVEVRYASADEKLVLLDGGELTLDESTLVIADADKAVALAGVMGGIDSGIGPETRDLFLEVAYFSPEAIAGRARRYGLNTDSAYRFERGVSPALQRRAMERATALLLAIVGGTPGPVTEFVHDAGLPVRNAIRLRETRIQRLLGMAIPRDQVSAILTRLGMKLDAADGEWRVTPPPFRFDVTLEADLVEEIARVYGYARLATRRIAGAVAMQPAPEARTAVDRMKALLVDRGYQEAITYSFIDADLSGRVDPASRAVPLANPLSVEMSVMRTSLWPGLLKTLQYNAARQQTRARLFEYGLKYISQQTDITQVYTLAGLVSGSAEPEVWAATGRSVDFFDIKGDLEALCGLARADGIRFEAGSHPALHPGQSAIVKKSAYPVGYIGKIHPKLAGYLGVPAATYLFELEVDELRQGEVPTFRKLSRFPSIRRDLAVVVDAGISSALLSRAVNDAAGELLKELLVFDVYSGKGVESGRKSVAFGLILQDSSRTLTETDVDSVTSAVIRQLEEQFGATLRE